MRQYSLLIYLLSAEVVTVFFLFLTIVFHRFALFLKSGREKKQKTKLSDFFLTLLEKKEPFDLKTYPGRKGWHKIALEVLESFNRRLTGREWTSIRNSACETLLLAKAHRWAGSLFWLKRNFSARTFALHSLPEDERKILQLLDDRKFLVRSPASLAAVRSESREGIEKILRAFSSEPGYGQFFYRDALIQGSQKVFQVIIQLAVDPNLHKAALDMLGAFSWGGTIPFLQADLASSDPLIRLLAFRVLKRNLLPESLSLFQRGAEDPDPKVRVAALQGLRLFPSEESRNVLEKRLADPVWEVRVAAGKVLKHQGAEGLAVLQRQPPGIPQEAAHYVLQFG